MADFEWRLDDARDLIRRDQKRVVRANSAFPCAAALLALWLRSTAPVAAGVFLGMAIAWTLSTISVWRSVRKNWATYVAAQFRPLHIALREDGLTWEGPHGSRVLRWEGLSVARVGTTYVLLIGGRELAYLPARVLSVEEAQRLQARLGAE